MISEEWRTVVLLGLECEISSFGRIKSKARIVIKSNGQKKFYNSIVYKTNINNYGYQKIKLVNKNLRKTFSLHRLVAEAFIPNPENKREVNHKNGNKSDNNVENLEWVTASENQLHAIECGLKPILYGADAPRVNFITTAYDISSGNKVCEMIGNQAMKENGFDYRLVNAVVHGKRKSHKGCYFTQTKLQEYLPNDN